MNFAIGVVYLAGTTSYGQTGYQNESDIDRISRLANQQVPGITAKELAAFFLDLLLKPNGTRDAGDLFNAISNNKLLAETFWEINDPAALAIIHLWADSDKFTRIINFHMAYCRINDKDSNRLVDLQVNENKLSFDLFLIDGSDRMIPVEIKEIKTSVLQKLISKEKTGLNRREVDQILELNGIVGSTIVAEQTVHNGLTFNVFASKSYISIGNKNLCFIPIKENIPIYSPNNPDYVPGGIMTKQTVTVTVEPIREPDSK